LGSGDNNSALKLKYLVDKILAAFLIVLLLPLLVFFAAFKLYGIYAATAAAIVASIVQVGLFWSKNRRFETIHLVTLAIILVFGASP